MFTLYYIKSEVKTEVFTFGVWVIIYTYILQFKCILLAILNV